MICEQMMGDGKVASYTMGLYYSTRAILSSYNLKLYFQTTMIDDADLLPSFICFLLPKLLEHPHSLVTVHLNLQRLGRVGRRQRREERAGA